MGDFEDGEGHVAMYAKELDGGDVHVLLGDSHAVVLRVHRVSHLVDGADRITQGESQAEVVGI